MDILVMPMLLLSQGIAETYLYTSFDEQDYICKEYRYHENITCNPRCTFYEVDGES